MDDDTNIALGLTPGSKRSPVNSPRRRNISKQLVIDIIDKKTQRPIIEDGEIKLEDLKNESSSISSIRTLPRVDSDERHFRRSNFWKSCCGTVIDKRSLQYFVQVTISATVMVFCMYKISNSEKGDCDCQQEDNTVYIALLSSIIGYYIPSPQLHHD